MIAGRVLAEWSSVRGWQTTPAFSLPVRVLWALALEIDERMATPTGERVCRACGGRGRTIVAWYPEGPIPGRRRWIADAVKRRSEVSRWVNSWTGPEDGDPPPLPGAVAEYDAYSDRALATIPCPCDGPTRPDTVPLRRLVAGLAALPTPRFAWPDHWLVLADEAIERGDWIGRWWEALRDWTWAGKMPDATALARDLAALVPALEERERAKRVRRAEGKIHTYATRLLVDGRPIDADVLEVHVDPVHEDGWTADPLTAQPRHVRLVLRPPERSGVEHWHWLDHAIASSREARLVHRGQVFDVAVLRTTTRLSLDGARRLEVEAVELSRAMATVQP